MLRKIVALLCALTLAIGPVNARQFRPGQAPNFRSGFQFIGGLPTYDFANGSYPPVTVSRASSGDLAADAAGTYTAFAANTLRRTNVGATIEGAQTNQIRNNSMQGAVAGTPGTLPQNWISSGSATVSVVGTGVENGIDYVDLQVVGAGSLTQQIIFEQTASVATASGQLWTASAFVKVVSGSLSGMSFLSRMREGGTNGAFQRDDTASFTPSAAALGSQRASVSATMGASTLFVSSGINVVSTGAFNVTLRIGGPQLERRDNYAVPVASASTPIRTTGTAATRAADAVSFTVPAGASKILYTFDDGSTQQVSVSPGAYTIPTNLNRPVIARAQVLP